MYRCCRCKELIAQRTTQCPHCSRQLFYCECTACTTRGKTYSRRYNSQRHTASSTTPNEQEAASSSVASLEVRLPRQVDHLEAIELQLLAPAILRLTRLQTDAYYALNQHGITAAQQKRWTRQIADAVLPVLSDQIDGKSFHFLSIPLLAAVYNAQPVDGVIRVVLFVDGVATSRFLGASVDVVFGRFSNSSAVFEVAFISRSFPIVNALASIVRSFHARIVNGSRMVFNNFATDLPARIKVAGCPGHRSNQGGCPNCTLSKEEMHDYTNRDLLLNAERRTIDSTSPLHELLGSNISSLLPTGPMHALYGFFDRLFTLHFLKTSDAWIADQGGSLQLRKELIDSCLSSSPMPADSHGRRPLFNSGKSFRFSDWKTFAGMACNLLPLFIAPFKQMLLWYLVFISAVESEGFPQDLRVRIYWRFVDSACASDVEFVPNIHSLLHLAQQHDIATGREDIFEAHVQQTHSDVLRSNKRNIEAHLLKAAQVRIALSYRYARVMPRIAASSFLTTVTTRASSTASSPADHPSLFYSSSLFFDNDGNLWQLLSPADQLVNELLATGSILLHNTHIRHDLDEDGERIQGQFTELGFRLNPFTPGWQPTSLIIYLINSFSFD